MQYVPKDMILYILAALMGIFTSWIVFYARNADNQIRKILAYVFLSMMNGMLIGPAIYLSGYLPFSILNIVLLSSAAMGIELIYPMIQFVRTLEGDSVKGVNVRIYVLFTIFDEFLMSLDFISISTGRSFLCKKIIHLASGFTERCRNHTNGVIKYRERSVTVRTGSPTRIPVFM